MVSLRSEDNSKSFLNLRGKNDNNKFKSTMDAGKDLDNHGDSIYNIFDFKKKEESAMDEEILYVDSRSF